MAHPYKDHAKSSRHAKVASMHSDAAEDRALVTAAIKRHENKMHAMGGGTGYARGGRVHMTAGADSGVGRLQKRGYGLKKSV